MPLNVEALNEVGRIFDWRPDPARYFATTATEQVRLALLTNLANGHGPLVVEGKAGAGKTLLVSTVVQSLPAHWAHVARLSFTVMSALEMASSIAYAFGMPPGPSVMSHQPPLEWIETQLRVWASCDESSLLVVDEAQHLPQDALHLLLALSQQQLHGRPVLRLILVGKPCWPDTLNSTERASTSAACATDIGPRFFVPQFTAAESTAYVQHRLSQYAGPRLPDLMPSAFAEIHARTQGNPGRINMLCQQLLHTAILLESTEPIHATAVALEADELLYYAEPHTPVADAATTAAIAPMAPDEVPVAPASALNTTDAPSEPSQRPAVTPVLLTQASTPAPMQPPTEAMPLSGAQAERQTPPLRTPAHPVARWTTWATGLAATSLLVGGMWWYAHRPAIQPTAPVSAQVPAEMPSAPTPIATEPPIATETSESPDPQTTALLTAPAASAAFPSSTPTTPLPKEHPHASPIKATPTSPTAQPTGTLPHALPPPAAATEATPMAKRLGPRTTSAQCTNLLAQMSLGEPLSTAQRRVLENQCR